MIKNIIFDIGNVLADFRWKEYIEELGIAPEKRERLALATTIGPFWCEMDRNVLSTEEVMQKCISLDKELEPEIRLFFKDRRRLVMEYPFAREWVESLKKRGYGIYYLSNYSEYDFGYINTHFSFFGLEDGKTVSCFERVIKPDERIYRTLLNRYFLNPEECVFLDDSERNVEAAEKLGIHGIVVKDHETAVSDLEKLLSAEYEK